MEKYLYETLIVDVSEKTHQKLTIHTIRHATVTWDTLAKILDLECPFYTASKETAKRSNQGCKASHYSSMEVDRCDPHLLNILLQICRVSVQTFV